MRNLTATICLTIAVLLGSMGVSASGDYQKGPTTYKSGDYATALREWTSLAEQGRVVAQHSLGVMHGLGTGVIQDNVYAHMWLNIAASSGNKDARKNRDIIAKEMTSGDISKAQDLARERIRKN